jgi:FixJ family two-component response regulator
VSTQLPRPSPQNDSRSATVFVVDDDADVRTGIESLLQSVGINCRTFASAREFLDGGFADEVSCLILDVRLPGLSGLDLQAELLRDNIDLPIIFITGHGDIPMTVKAMKAGAVEFLSKPVREQDLLDAVGLALECHRTRREAEAHTNDWLAKYQALTLREQDVMKGICAGLMNKQVAGEIGVSEVTVKVHRHNLMKKFGTRSLVELVRIADYVVKVSPRGHEDAFDLCAFAAKPTSAVTLQKPATTTLA